MVNRSNDCRWYFPCHGKELKCNHISRNIRAFRGSIILLKRTQYQSALGGRVGGRCKTRTTVSGEIMGLLAEIRTNPIIAAVRDIRDLEKAVASKVNAIFLLTGDINSLSECVEFVQEAGKGVYLHLDLIKGLGHDRAAVGYLARKVKPNGVISTRSNLLKSAKAEGLYTIQRIFMLDSLSLRTAMFSIRKTEPDAVECLPAIIPRVFSELVHEVRQPIIAGGLIKHYSELIKTLRSGVKAVSISSQQFWNYSLKKEDFDESRGIY